MQAGRQRTRDGVQRNRRSHSLASIPLPARNRPLPRVLNFGFHDSDLFRVSDFELRICFGFRISDFELRISLRYGLGLGMRIINLNPDPGVGASAWFVEIGGNRLLLDAGT